MLRDGLGRPKDEAKARELFAKAHAAGDPEATYHLAPMFRDGLGGPPHVRPATSIGRRTFDLLLIVAA